MHHRLRSLALAATSLAIAPVVAQNQRPVIAPGQTTNAVPKAGVDSVVTTDMSFLTPQQLAQALLGPGVTASNVLFTGGALSAGTFQGGLAVVGIDNGIMLSSGNIGSVVGPNASDSTSTVNNTAGDAQLDALTTSPTFDACTLEFDFSCATGGQITFQYVFS